MPTTLPLLTLQCTEKATSNQHGSPSTKLRAQQSVTMLISQLLFVMLVFRVQTRQLNILWVILNIIVRSHVSLVLLTSSYAWAGMIVNDSMLGKVIVIGDITVGLVGATIGSLLGLSVQHEYGYVKLVSLIV